MKKVLFICALVLLAGFSSCKKEAAPKEEKISIVAAIFPEYDWCREILGSRINDGNVSLSLVVQNGTDLHSFQPSAADIIKITSADLFIYTGGESDEWVKEALKNAGGKKIQALNLMEELGENVKEEEITEGMTAGKKSGTDAGADAENPHNHDSVEYDEHIWLSLHNAKSACQKIAARITLLLPDAAADIAKNLSAYEDALGALDGEYEKAAAASELKTFIFCDRFPFRYLADDYGIKYYAAFTGCSAETEASFETVAFLSKKIDELKPRNVFIIDSSDKKLARTIIENSSGKDCGILVLDSMQSVSFKQIQEGKNYLGTMRENLEQLRKAL